MSVGRHDFGGHEEQPGPEGRLPEGIYLPPRRSSA
jgi:hypothetical protein